MFSKNVLRSRVTNSKVNDTEPMIKKLIHFPLKIFNKNNFTFYFNGEILNSISNLGKVN